MKDSISREEIVALVEELTQEAEVLNEKIKTASVQVAFNLIGQGQGLIKAAQKLNNLIVKS